MGDVLYKFYLKSDEKIMLHINGLAQDCGIPTVNTLTLRQNGRYVADGILNCIFSNENILILIKIWLKFIPNGPTDNKSTLVQIMALHWSGGKPLSESMMA